MKRFAAMLLALMLIASMALAEVDLSEYTITNANVQAVHYVDITAPCAGTLMPFTLRTGDKVDADAVLFSLMTTDIFATEDGTVTALLAEEGDDAAAVMKRYGSLGAMDPASEQQLSCTTSGAYNDDDNKILHVGETLYFKSSKSGAERGSGVVTSVSGSSYVVEIRSGSFSPNETMNMYRSDRYEGRDNVGKGTVIQRSPITFSGSGIVSEVCVTEGSKVKNGDRIMSLLPGTARRGVKPDITAEQAGVIGAISVAPGQQVWEGQLLCRLYLTGELEITADVDEIDMKHVQPGQAVYLTLDTDKNNVITGQVTWVSALGMVKNNASYYTVHVSLPANNELMLGQSASLYLPKD